MEPGSIATMKLYLRRTLVLSYFIQQCDALQKILIIIRSRFHKHAIRGVRNNKPNKQPEMLQKIDKVKNSDNNKKTAKQINKAIIVLLMPGLNVAPSFFLLVC